MGLDQYLDESQMAAADAMADEFDRNADLIRRAREAIAHPENTQLRIDVEAELQLTEEGLGDILDDLLEGDDDSHVPMSGSVFREKLLELLKDGTMKPSDLIDDEPNPQ